MTTRLATPVRNAAVMMLDSGVSINVIEKELNALKQPSAGLVYIGDVTDLIKKLTK